ncbi:hypothetical protein [Burkholderia sp. ABCPW 14]|uniref:hypothetical protein n=1 Tax=Burkholderia sp. ABCPW 14 TaxID=1637860 RepID=UPI0012E3868B|nr:hypothetical protein [Burkholderia sp. ABCPW 14]
MRNSTPIVWIARAMPRGIFYTRPQAPPVVLAGGTRPKRSFDTRSRIEISANISKFLVNIFACNLLRIV